MTEIRSTTFVPVPRSQVVLQLTKGQLNALPSDAVYTKKQGRATATVRQNGDTIVIYATCDSLLLQCEKYQKDIIRIRSQTEQYEQEIKQNIIKTAFNWCVIGIIIGIIMTFISIKIIKSHKKK